MLVGPPVSGENRLCWVELADTMLPTRHCRPGIWTLEPRALTSDIRPAYDIRAVGKSAVIFGERF